MPDASASSAPARIAGRDEPTLALARATDRDAARSRPTTAAARRSSRRASRRSASPARRSRRTASRTCGRARGTRAPLLVFAGHTDVVPTGPLERWRSDPFEPDRARRLAVRPRRRRHEDVDRGVRRRGRGIRRRASRPSRLGRVPDHVRRGRSRDRRHRARLRRAEGARRDARLLHRRRAELGRAPRRHDQERPPRHAVRPSRRQGRAGPHRVSATRGQPDPEGGRARSPRCRRSNGTAATSTSRRPASRSRTSTPAPARRTSSRATRSSTSTSASRPRATVESLQRRVRAMLDEHAPRLRRSTWTVGGLPFLTPAGALSAALAGAIARVTGVDAELSTTGGTSDGRFIARDLPRDDGVRAGQRDDPPDRRARRRRRHRAAEGRLPRDAGGAARAVMSASPPRADDERPRRLRHDPRPAAPRRQPLRRGRARVRPRQRRRVGRGGVPGAAHAAPAARPARSVPRRARDGARARRGARRSSTAASTSACRPPTSPARRGSATTASSSIRA